MLRHRISTSLRKIISDCDPSSNESPTRIRSPCKRLSTSVKLNPIFLRSLEPPQTPVKMYVNQYKTNTQKNKLKQIIRRYDSNHIPTNASKSRYDNDLSSTSPRIKSRNRSSLHTYDEHLTYDELMLVREKEYDFKKLIILKQVIRENVKKKNEEMKIYSKKRMKTIL